MSHVKTPSFPDFDDNNFLQNWLENRYGCGFAQVVMDDLSSQENITEMSCLLPDNLASNDNAHHLGTLKAS